MNVSGIQDVDDSNQIHSQSLTIHSSPLDDEDGLLELGVEELGFEELGFEELGLLDEGTEELLLEELLLEELLLEDIIQQQNDAITYPQYSL